MKVECVCVISLNKEALRLVKQMKINDTYEITIDGTVINTKTGRILKTHVSGSDYKEGKGYKTLRLGKGKHYTVHRLVANAFLPAPTSEGCVIDHIDRNRQNNHASNLRWVSHKENMGNLSVETKPRASNKTGNHHIKTIMTKRQKTPTYAVVFCSKTIKHYSIHKTVDDAIKKRNLILLQNNALQIEKE
jgi:HNH endonuclease